MSLTPADRVRRGRVRGVVAILFLLAWGVALSGLVQRDVQRSAGQRMAELALRVNPGNVFYSVTQNGRHIGWASSTIDTLPDTSATFLVLRDEMVADLDVAGTTQRINAQAEIRMTRAFALQTFDVDVGAPGMQERVAGRAEGDSSVAYVTGPRDRRASATAADTQRVRVAGPILLPELLPLATVLGDNPSVGRSVAFSAFDPATRAARPITVEIVAESLFTVEDSARMDEGTGRWVGALRDTVRAWRVVSNAAQGDSSWIDAQGRVVEAKNQFGVTLRRVAFEMAFENWRLEAAALAAVRGAASGGIDERSVIAASVPIPRRELVSLRVRLTTPSLNRFQLDDGRQRLSGSEVTIQAESADRFRASYTIPVDGAHRTTYRETLGDDLLLHLRSQSIVRLSAQVSRSESDPRVVVERLTRWVHDSLSKVASTSVPDALVVLTARRGDANEHTQLFTAVARSLGIPTRVVVGLVLVSGKFYYHSWPEVFLGDWVAADPTFGQFPVGATHLRLMHGGLERQAELKRLLTSLNIEVLEAR